MSTESDTRVMQDESSPKAKMAVPEAELASSKTRLDLIRAKIADRDFPLADVLRLIGAEIAMVVQDMVSQRVTADNTNIVRGLAQQVKALRALSKQLMDVDKLTEKEDILNFDGKKFHFAMGKLMDLFVKAMQEAGVPQDLRISVVKHYRDLLAQSEPAIRRETQKLGTKKGA